MSDDRSRRLLKIVRRQHVVGGGDEGFEKSPGLPGDQAQGGGVRLGGRAATGDLRRSTDAKRRGRRHNPDQGERRRQRPRSLPPNQADRDRRRADDDGPDHPAVEDRQTGVCAIRGVRRRNPFQQPPPRDRQTHQGAQDGVGHQPGLVGQKHDHQARLDQGQAKFRGQRAHVAGDDDAGSARNDAGQDRAERLGDDRRQDIGRPNDRRV